MAVQVKNGKAFEYALAKVYFDELSERGLQVQMIEDDAYKIARCYFEGFNEVAKSRYVASAKATLDTILKIEPGLTAQKDVRDILTIRIAKDREGQTGDVRDVIFCREMSHWEIGFSAKNNNDSQKHSRLSETNNFAKKWFGIDCSEEYWNSVLPVFEFIKGYKRQGKSWDDMGKDKDTWVYVPLLNAFRDEILRINDIYTDFPQRLISYIIGVYPFYQIIKEDSKNLVVVKAFNVGGGLNKMVNKMKSRYKVSKIEPPTRIVEFEYAPKPEHQMKDTLNMILDGGWEIAFRIHSADDPIIPSLKFDMKLLGNPPILFSQYLFQ